MTDDSHDPTATPWFRAYHEGLYLFTHVTSTPGVQLAAPGASLATCRERDRSRSWWPIIRAISIRR